MLKVRTQISQFFNAKHIVHGSNSLIALKGLQAVKIAIIVGQSIIINKKKIEYIKENINNHDLLIISRSWTLEPELTEMDDSLNELQNFQPDCIIAIGGGSVIDGAKILWTFYEHPELKDKSDFETVKIPRLRGKSKFIAVPTTIGTGSEVSSSAVLFDPKSGKKIPIVTNDYLPDLVILDSKLVVGIPKNIMVSTMLDACAHAIEGYVSKIENLLMDQFAFNSLKIILDNSKKILENSNDEKTITNLQYAAMMAGWVQNHCLIGVSHAIAHQMGSYKLSHGIANSIFLPESIIFNSKDSKNIKKYNKIALFCGLKNGMDELVDTIKILAESGEFSTKLSSYGIKKENFDNITKLALEDPGAKYNPLNLDEESLITILDKTL
tara:strand:+ start:360 stop:1505 length:1146 start_codon:yes stop_codon:yes gene_type:complete